MRSFKETNSDGRMFIKRTSKEEQRKRVRAFSFSTWEEEASVRCWKRIMNIVFSIQWKILIILSVFCTIYSLMLRILTTPSVWDQDYSELNTALLICTFIYLLDTIARIVHMKVKSLRITQSHKMYPLKFIVLDVISLLPLFLVYSILPKNAFYPSDYDLIAIFQINQFIRIYRIPVTMRELDTTFIFNPVLLYLIEVICYVSIYILFQSFIWLQVLGRWYGVSNSWLLYIRNLFHHEDSLNWFLVTITTVHTMICRYFEGSIQLTNNIERVIAATTWFTAVMLEYGIIFGGLLPALGSSHKLRYNNLEVVEYLEHDMKVRGVSSSTVERTRTYYQELWKRASGIKVPMLFDSLPLSLRKEIMLDCFWDTFKHSNLLSGHPLDVKRSLCMVMEHEYYLPGEYLFRSGTMKDKMVYIVNGVVDVLAVEDECTAVASFSAGTCLSEASLAYQYKGENTIRCATFCVVQILHTWDALTVLNDYPQSTSEIAEILMQRIHLANEVRHNAEALRPTALDPLDEHAILLGEIKWVKDHWRKMFEMEIKQRRSRAMLKMTQQQQQLHLAGASPTVSPGVSSTTGSAPGTTKSSPSKSKSVSREQAETPAADKSFTVEEDYDYYVSRFAHTCAFFDLFALTDESQKATEDVVCSRVHFPWILKTESDFTSAWEVALVVVVTYECYILPFYLSFYKTLPSWVFGWGVLSDAIVIVDLLIIVHTAVPGIPVALFPIIVYRFQTLSFYLKLLASIPWHWLAIGLGSDEYDAWRLRYIRMLWMLKMFKWFYKWASTSGERSYLVKYVICFGSIFYWMTCLHHLYNCYYDLCEEESWYYNNKVKQIDFREYTTNLFDKMMTVTLYVASNMLRVPLIWASARSFSDVILQNVLLFLSMTLKCYFLAEFCSLQMLRDRGKRRFRDLLSRIEYYHSRHKIPEMTFQQLKLYLKFQWQNNPVFDVWGDRHQESLPRYLLTDIQETARETVRSIPLFVSASSELVEELAKTVRFFHCPKAMELVRAGQHPSNVYVLKRGLCRAVSHWRSDVERHLQWTLATGECFPLMEVMHGIPSVLTVLTDSACVVAMIEVRHLQRVLAKFPAELRLVYSVVQEHNAVWNVSEIPMEDATQNYERAKQEGRARRRMLRRYMAQKENMSDPDSQDTQRVVIENSSSSDTENEGTQFEEETVEYERMWKELAFGRALRLILRPVSFDPAREFVFAWECARVTLAVVACLLHPCAFSALIGSLAARIICYLLDLLCLVDIYVRLQIGYYNADGVLITHPALTTKYYVKNAFAADLISCLPLELMPVEFLFTVKSYTMLRYYIRLLRCVQIYRFLEFMDHLGERLSYRFLLSNFMKMAVTLVIVINIIANAAMFWNCDVKTEGKNVFLFQEVSMQCHFDTYISDTFLKITLDTPGKVYLIHLYYGLVVYTSTLDGLFVFTRRNVLRTVILSFITFACRNWLIAVFTSILTANRWQLTHSSHTLEEVLGFLRREGVDEQLVRLTEEAFEYEWTRRHGFNISDLLKKVPPLLQGDVLFNRCVKALALVTHLQGVNEFLLCELSRNVEFLLFNKGRFIFRLNDVQDYVYILETGRVEVIGAGNTSLCVLRRGALFGNLPRQRRMRQTCGILVRANCVVMSLSNEVFYGMLEKYPEILERFDHVHEANLEYVPEMGHETTVNVPIIKRKDKANLAVTRQDLLRIYASKKTVYAQDRSLGLFFKNLVATGNIWTLFGTITMYVIIPASIICVVINTPLRTNSIVLIAIIYVCDLVFVIKIIVMIWFRFHKTDLILEEGEVSTRAYLLHSLSDPTALPVEIASTIPLELFTGIHWFLYNRLLRFVSYIKFYTWKYSELNASLGSRWMRVFMISTMVVSCLTSLYILFRCDEGRYCEYLTDLNRMHKGYFHVGTSMDDVICLAFMFAVSRLTCTSFTEPPIYTVGALVYNVLVTILHHVLMIVLATHCANLVCGTRTARCDYRFKVDRMDARLQVMNVTEPLRKKAKQYLSNLWRDEHGYAMPSWLETGPKDLRFDLMAVMYGAHLRKDPVMGHGHEDLLLQITGYLRRNVFYPKDVIAERGDVNGCLYILDKGEVKAMVPDQFQLEAVAFKVPPGRLFGVKSGLFEGKPHEYTYRATTISVVLTLYQEDWKFLFEFFPASKTNIFTQATYATI